MFKETSHAHIEQLVRKRGFHIALDSLLEETEQKPSEVADLHHEVSICVCLYYFLVISALSAHDKSQSTNTNFAIAKEVKL